MASKKKDKPTDEPGDAPQDATPPEPSDQYQLFLPEPLLQKKIEVN
jgi:hypothetical protein